MSSIDRTRTRAARQATIQRKCARHLKHGNARLTRSGGARVSAGEM